MPATKFTVSLPAELYEFVEHDRGGDSRSAYLAELVRQRRAATYRRGYLEQPESGDDYSQALLIAAMADNPYEQ